MMAGRIARDYWPDHAILPFYARIDSEPRFNFGWWLQSHQYGEWGNIVSLNLLCYPVRFEFGFADKRTFLGQLEALHASPRILRLPLEVPVVFPPEASLTFTCDTFTSFDPPCFILNLGPVHLRSRHGNDIKVMCIDIHNIPDLFVAARSIRKNKES